MDVSTHLAPAECPESLRRWAEALVGRWLGQGRRARIVAGWRWDGVSDEVVLIIAPRGTRTLRIPTEIWAEVRP